MPYIYHMTILGISAFFHDAAAAIIEDGKVIAAAQEERFSRIKNDAAFPSQAVRFCLEFTGLNLDQLDAVVFYDKPLLKFERILESYHSRAPRGLRSFLTAMPVWMKQKMLLKKVIRDELYRVQPFGKKRCRLLFCEHHLSHAASAFFPSPFASAAILTIDGVGEWATTSIGVGEGKDIRFLKEIHFPHSLGLLYSAFTYYCGFEVNAGEYKLMGLAPYGDEKSAQFLAYEKKILDTLCTVYEDGSIFLHQDYFNYISGLRMVPDHKWETLFGFPPRQPEAELLPCHCNMALAVQRVTETIVLKLAATAKRLTGLDNLCLAGGVALNCVANGKLLDTGLFKNIFIQPAAGDAGGAPGAALAAYHVYFAKDRGGPQEHAYLGPAFQTLPKGAHTTYTDTTELLETVAARLQEGKIVGWFQGRMEFGPRALGNRSILADPRNASMQRKLNLSIKYREGFRPFAPACTLERAEHYFGLRIPSPYMLLTRPLNPALCEPLPEGYQTLPMREKLQVVRSQFPSITHVDLSCRVQTVSPENNLLFWQLLKAFERLTGEAMLINTSFNVRDEPIVCTPQQAYDCFVHTEMDILVIGHTLYKKEDQPAYLHPINQAGPWNS